MIFLLIVKPEAREELALTAIYYESLSPGLGIRFVDAWERTAADIQRHPQGYALKKGNFRQVMFRRFPYLVVFEILGNKVVVYAIIHARKHPSKRYKRKG